MVVDESVRRAGVGTLRIVDRDGLTKPTIQIIAEEALDFVATYHHAEAQRLRDEERYRAAAAAYDEFLARFPQSPRGYKVRYHVAEIRFRIADYEGAAARYREVVSLRAGETITPVAAPAAVVAVADLVP